MVYLGFAQEFIEKRQNISYEERSESEIMTDYLEVLWYAKQALYDFQLKPMNQVLENIEKHVTDKMFNDLKNLSDKDIIIKYELKPEKIDIKYLGKEPNDIKPSAKTDVLGQRENFYRQYEEKYGKLDEGNRR